MKKKKVSFLQQHLIKKKKKSVILDFFLFKIFFQVFKLIFFTVPI